MKNVNNSKLRELNMNEIQLVNGGLAPWAIGFGVAAIFGGGYSAGYAWSRDYLSK